MAISKLTFEDDILITQDQASELLSIPAATLQKWRSTGENNIPYVKIGRNVRYHPPTLKLYRDNHTRGGEAA